MRLEIERERSGIIEVEGRRGVMEFSLRTESGLVLRGRLRLLLRFLRGFSSYFNTTYMSFTSSSLSSR